MSTSLKGNSGGTKQFIGRVVGSRSVVSIDVWVDAIRADDVIPGDGKTWRIDVEGSERLR